jgi:hypothetical protein
MPKRRKYEIIHCPYFKWRLISRQGVWYADGRSNVPNPGRHSLGTRDKKLALDYLPELDRSRAVDLGLTPPPSGIEAPVRPLPLEEGRRLYEQFVKRPRVTGGVYGAAYLGVGITPLGRPGSEDRRNSFD